MNKQRRKIRGAKAAPEAAVPPKNLPSAMKDDATRRRRIASIWLIVALLIAAILLTYADVLHYGFVNYDDPQYVSDNPQVTAGLTFRGMLWAFNTGYQANWHPLTWLSHMLDVELYGLNAGAHHLTNVLLHTASTLLLFWLLWQMTGRHACSAFVAALFAVHPLHVESVAWVAERKDVLSTFFGMLTLCAYLLYVRQPRWSRLVAVVVLFALSLMAKPMLVTLPFALLLLDYWPLQRFVFGSQGNAWKRIREKTALFMLVAASSAVTVIAQQKGGAVVRFSAIPLADRFANAFITYIAYLWKTFWPARLAVLYQTTRSELDLWSAAAIAVIGLSMLAIWAGRQRPYIPVGWFWYLGTLVPVIGLVQVGRQTMADRYTYVPSIGLYVIVAFGLADAFSRTSARKLLPIAGVLAILALMAVSRTQVGYWSSSRALWEHTLETGNADSYAYLGLAYAAEQEGKLDEAKQEYSEAVRLDPSYPQAQYNLATILAKQDQWDEAATHYREAIRLSGGDQVMAEAQLVIAHYGVGRALANEGKMDEAAEHFAEAIRLNPAFPEARNAIGLVHASQGRLEEAGKDFSEAIRLNPKHVSAHNSLGTILSNMGRTDEAIAEYQEAVRLMPGYADARTNLGVLLAKQGRTAEAIAQFSEALKISPGNAAAYSGLKSLSANVPPPR